MKGFYQWMTFLGAFGAEKFRGFLAAEDRRAFVVDAARDFYGEVVEPLNMPGPDAFIDPFLKDTSGVLAGRLYDALLKLYPDVPDKLAANSRAVDEYAAALNRFEAQVNGVG